MAGTVEAEFGRNGLSARSHPPRRVPARRETQAFVFRNLVPHLAKPVPPKLALAPARHGDGECHPDGDTRAFQRGLNRGVGRVPGHGLVRGRRFPEVMHPCEGRLNLMGHYTERSNAHALDVFKLVSDSMLVRGPFGSKNSWAELESPSAGRCRPRCEDIMPASLSVVEKASAQRRASTGSRCLPQRQRSGDPGRDRQRLGEPVRQPRHLACPVRDGDSRAAARTCFPRTSRACRPGSTSAPAPRDTSVTFWTRRSSCA